MTLRHVLAASVLVSVAALPGAVGAVPASATPPNLDCPSNIIPGKPLTTTPWPSRQLDLPDLALVNQGQYVKAGRFDGRPFSAGSPVAVAVIDSGLITVDGRTDTPDPIFEGADIPPKPHKTLNWSLDDCVGHGTAVSSLIVGQPGHSLLAGIAPRVRLIPIQYTNVAKGGTALNLQRALTFAISQHPRVINMSLQLPNRPDNAIMTLLREARREHIVIVAAGGNDDGQEQGAVYPAALSTTFDNIIAVSAVAENGSAAGFGITGHYIDVAAPGVDISLALRFSGVYTDRGTSFAAPFVTGTVALMLATHPSMMPAEVKNRLEATTDPPPGDQPNSVYGWGMINPLQAVTSERNDVLPTPSAEPRGALPAPRAAAAPDRTLQHRALAIAVVLLGLAALTVTAAAILRGQRRQQSRRS